MATFWLYFLALCGNFVLGLVVGMKYRDEIVEAWRQVW